MSSSSTSRSLFKSCRYCQRRKKKCILPPADSDDSRCLACQHLNTVCDIDVRKPSIKRQLKSQMIASTLSASPNDVRSHASSLSPGSKGSVLRGNGDCQVLGSEAGSEGNASKTIIVEDINQKAAQLPTLEKYRTIVKREFPFILDEYLTNPKTRGSPLLNHCVEMAANLSLRGSCQGSSQEDMKRLYALVEDTNFLGVADATGLLLLLPRIVPYRPIVRKTLLSICAQSENEDAQYPLAIAAGVLTTSTWLTMVGHLWSFPRAPSSLLLEYAQTLDQETFAPHYLKMTHLAASIIDLKDIPAQNGATSDAVKVWAELEYNTLLNVAQMPSEYLDVRDDMPANPGAVVTHMLQSMIFLRIYEFLLCLHPEVGKAIGLRPVPGVMHFICAITRSIFICPSQIINHWPIFGDVQAAAAEILLDFWRLTKAENCRALLNLWSPIQKRFGDLETRVREEIGDGPWDVELIDGYSVFWMFRDLRSLSLEAHLSK